MDSGYTSIIEGLKLTLPPNTPPTRERIPIHVIRKLLAAGADPNSEYRGITVLELASGYEKEDAVKVLLEYHADPNRTTSSPYSKAPIIRLLTNRISESRNTTGAKARILELLLASGADPNAYDGATPLIYAGTYSNIECMEILLKYKADPNIQDINGNTCLHTIIYPITEQKLTLIKLLLASGADKNIHNNVGKTPLDLLKARLDMVKPGKASEKMYEELFELLGNTTDTDIANNMSLGINSSTADAHIIPFKSLHMEGAEGMTILTIPKGTLLYNSFIVDEKQPSEEVLLKLMGGILPFSTTITHTESTINISICLDQFSQKFFYSSPVGGIALGGVATGFNATAVFETKRDLRVAVLMSPTDYHRLGGKGHPSKISCYELNTKYCQCALELNNNTPNGHNRHKCKYGYTYDVCLQPPFLHKHSLDGHVAIADQDSYEEHMKSFDINFMNSSLFGKKLHKLNRVLFDGGLSLDGALSGLPEIVLHTFDTNWYGDKEKINSSHSIDIPPNSTAEDRINILSKFLIDYNNDRIETLGFQTPLRLLGVSTVKQFHNFMTGVQKPNAFYDNPRMKSSMYNFYVNYLNAFLDGDLRFFFDTRTGFLMNEKGVPSVEMEDGSIVSFADLSVRGAPAMEGATLLERSFMARMAGTFWNKSDCLVPKVGKAAAAAGAGAGQAGGKLKTITRNTRRNNRLYNKITRKNTKTTARNVNVARNTPKKANPYVMAPQIEDLYRILLEQIRASA